MGIRVGLGIATFGFEEPAGWFRFVEQLEEAGVDSVWQTDRLLSKEPYLEAMASMAALAGATERIKFGMNAVVVGFRDPLVLAKQCATIDYLSGGRLLPVFGVGTGNAPEWEGTGKPAAGRGARANEALELLRRLWSEEVVDFEGEHYRYQGARIAPRPVQQPLPLWIGGSSQAAIRRTARLGSGWLAGITPADEVGPVIQAIQRETARVGRRIDPDHFGASIPFRLTNGDEDADPALARFRGRAGQAGDPSRIVVVGKADALIERIAAYVRAGASKFVLLPLATGEREIRAQAERAIAEVLPVVEAPGFAEQAQARG